MLTIENYSKLFRKQIGQTDWRIARIDEIKSAYLFKLMTDKAFELQINLERLGTGSLSDKEYELWCWNDIIKGPNGGIAGTAVPKRIMIKKWQIQNIDYFIDNIELLIRSI